MKNLFYALTFIFCSSFFSNATVIINPTDNQTILVNTYSQEFVSLEFQVTRYDESISDDYAFRMMDSYNLDQVWERTAWWSELLVQSIYPNQMGILYQNSFWEHATITTGLVEQSQTGENTWQQRRIDTLQIRFKPNQFIEHFWSGTTEKIVHFMVGTGPQFVEWSNIVRLTFVNVSAPPAVITPADPNLLVPTPNGDISLPIEVVMPGQQEPALTDFSFSWSRNKQGVSQYWDGNQWQTQPTYIPFENQSTQYRMRQEQPSQALLELEEQGNDFWDGKTSAYHVQVRYHANATAPPSPLTTLNLQLAPPDPTTLETPLWVNTDSIRVRWEDPRASDGGHLYEYKVGIQKVADGTWLDPYWWDTPVRGDRLSESYTAVLASRVEPQQMYRVLVYRLRLGGALDQHSLKAAEAVTVSDLPALAGGYSLEGTTLLNSASAPNAAGCDGPSVSLTGGAVPFHVVTCSPTRVVLNFRSSDLVGDEVGAVSKDLNLYFGLRKWDGTWLTPDWRRRPITKQTNTTPISLNLSQAMLPERMYDLVMATGDRHSRSEVITVATVSYLTDLPPEGPWETRPRHETRHVKPPKDYATQLTDLELRLQPSLPAQRNPSDPTSSIEGILVQGGDIASPPVLVELVSRAQTLSPEEDNVRLVFRLYEPNGDGFEIVRTSSGVPFSHLTGPDAQEHVSRDIRDLLLSENPVSGDPHPSSLVPRPDHRPYRLFAFFTTAESGQLPPDNLVSMIVPFMLPQKFEMSFAGKTIAPIFNPITQELLASTSIPVHFRNTPEFILHPFDWTVEGERQNFVFHRNFPAQAAVNFGDALTTKAQWLHAWRGLDGIQGPEHFSVPGTFKIYRKVDQNYELVETRHDSSTLVFDDTFYENESYRIVFEARDRFGVTQQMVQDIAEVRKLSDARFVLAFGGRVNGGPFEEKVSTAVYGNHNAEMITSYTGTRPAPHQFVIRSQHPVRWVFNPITQTHETRALPDAEVLFQIEYRNEHGGIRIPNGLKSQYTLSEPSIVRGCYESGLNQAEKIAPYPIKTNHFQLRDNLTERVVALSSTDITILFDPDIQEPVCPEVGGEPTPVGGIALKPSPEPPVWHYGTQTNTQTGTTTSTMFDFELPTTVRISGSRYQQHGPWFIGLQLRNPIDGDSVYENMPLNAYLDATGQNRLTINTENIHHFDLRVVPSAFDSAQNWWRQLQLNTSEALTEPNTGGQPLVFVQISLFADGANPNDPADSRWLAHSNNAHGGGIPLLIERGEPPFNAELTHLAYQSLSPNQLQVVEGDTRQQVFTQTLDVNNDLSRAKLLQGRFYWQLRSNAGYFDGSVWVPSPTDLTLGQIPFLKDVSLRLNREEGLLDIQAVLHPDQIPAAFWQNETDGLNLQFDVSYQPGQTSAGSTPARLQASNPSDLEAYRMQMLQVGKGRTELEWPKRFQSGVDIQDPLASLNQTFPTELEHALQRAFAPEPMILQAKQLGIPVRQTWIVSKGSSAWVDPNKPPSGPLTEEIYAWLDIEHNPTQDNGRHQVFLVPYPEQVLPWHGFSYGGRTPISLQHAQTEWTRTQNCYSRFVTAADSVVGHYQIIVFVPSTLARRQSLGKQPQSPSAGNDALQSFLNQNPNETAWGASESHNRIVNVSYPNPNNPNHRIVNVQFWDLTGRAQESRTMATHAPLDWLDHVAVSGAVTYDAFGRVIKAAKDFPLNQYDHASLFDDTKGSPPSNTAIRSLATAGTIEQAFAAGQAYWIHGSASGTPQASLDHIQDRTAPYAETVYEEDATRSRVLATVPPGAQARDEHDVLRFNRNHHALIPTYSGVVANRPDACKLVLVNFDIGNNALAQKTSAAQEVAGLAASLAIDANGLMRLELTNRTGANLVSIGNPSIHLLQDWGFQVQVAAPGTTKASIDLDNSRVWLPKDYYDRINPTAAISADLNLVSLSEVNDQGLLIASWPPKALTITAVESGIWAISRIVGKENLSIRYQHDHLGRNISIQEPDAGETEFVYDRHGRQRLARDANDRTLDRWTEWVHDAVGRVIETRSVVIENRSSTGSPNRQALQDWFDDVTQAPHDVGPLNPESALYQIRVVAESSVTTTYDQYRTSGTSPPWADGPDASERERVAFWPTMDALIQAYPWSDEEGPLTFGRPNGQIVEIASTSSAERLYYDVKGRPVCLVTLLRGVLEPQILWQRFDNRDLVTATYNQTHHLGTGYVYDAFHRIIGVHDLTPFSERMRVNVSFRHALSNAYDKTKTILGPLVDSQSEWDEATKTVQLAARRFTPSGHITHVRYGEAAGTPIENTFTYDIRDWLLSQTVTIAGQPAYSVKLDQIGANHCFDHFDCNQEAPATGSDVLPMHDGSIAVLSETYHLEGAAGRQTRHEYRYDGNYQITKAVQHRRSVVGDPRSTERLDYQYRYDRNGNRQSEARHNVFSPHIPLPHDADLRHVLEDGTNRLAGIEAQDAAGTFQPIFQFGYDDLGNVSRIHRLPAPAAHGEREVEQQLSYGDPRFTHQPTEVTQTVLSGNANEDAPFQTETRTYRYDHHGTRTYRTLTRNGKTEEKTFFVPSGTENAVELDGWGRARRAYLFSGTERIGYKSSAHTAVYVTDHLGSTKMVVALNRSVPTEPVPSSPDAHSLNELDHHLLADLALDGSLANKGTLQEKAFEGDPSYTDRNGSSALWLDLNESLQLQEHAAVEAMSRAFSISLWLYDADEDDGLNDHSTLVAVGNQLSIRYNPVHFYLDGQKLPVLRLGGGPDGWQFFSRFSRIPARTWTHLAVTFDGTFVRCYQDGELLGEPDRVTLPALWPARDIAVGNWLDYDGYAWHGGLDEVLIRSDPLSQQEIRQHYLKTKEPLAATLRYQDVSNSSMANREDVRRLLVVAYSDSDVFGVPLEEDHSNEAVIPEPHTFTGQETERGTGLVYMNGRWYLPEAGRFIQVDPMRQFWNPYSYVGNNPINRNDPTGKVAPLLALGASAATGISWGAAIKGTGAVLWGIAAYLGIDYLADQLDNQQIPPSVYDPSSFQGRMNPGFPIPISGADHGFSEGPGFSLPLPLAPLPGLEQGNPLPPLPSSDNSQIEQILLTLHAESIITNITKEHGLFMCEECASSVKEALLAAGLSGTEILIKYRTGPGLIVSDMNGPQPMSSNGEHFGILFNGLVYDNIHKTGIELAKWLEDFHGYGERTVEERPFGDNNGK